MPFVLVFFFYAVVNLRSPNISRGESFKRAKSEHPKGNGGLKWLFVICSAYASQVVAPFLPNRLRDFGGLKWLFVICSAYASQVVAPFLPNRLRDFGGLKWLFVICSACASQVFAPFLPNRLRDFGGLKWTRTIDLTLIRRVL